MIAALITPYYFPSVRGNSVTVQRIESGLREGRQGRGAVPRPTRPERSWGPSDPGDQTFVHGFHAAASGPLVAEAAGALGIPSVITLTGTDVNQDLFDSQRCALVREPLNAARAIVVFHEAIGEIVRRTLPNIAGKLRVIGQAVLCKESRYDLRATLGLHPGDFVFLHPAGVRRIKNIPAVIPWLATLQHRHFALKYILAGPVIESHEAERLLIDPALRTVMGRRAQSKTTTHFRLEGEIGQYLALYRELISGRGA